MHCISRYVIAGLSLTVVAAGCTGAQDARKPEPPRAHTDSMTSAGGGYTTTVAGTLSDSIVHLVTGDSLEWQSFGPLRITGKPEGLLVTYHPFVDLADTTRLRGL